MSKNNLIRKSDKKFIRHEKARIRRQFFDTKKQKELIDELYKRFSGKPQANVIKEPTSAKSSGEAKEKIEVKKETKKTEIAKPKKEKVAKKAKAK